MKIALYIEDGLEQIVLTPQTDTEKAILSKLHSKTRSLQIERGSFYECRGGWVRHGYITHGTLYGNSTDDESTLIVLRPPKPCQESEGEEEMP